MEVTSPDRDQTTAIVDLWEALADDQRAHDSHVLPEENRTVIRESVLRRIVNNELLVAEDKRLHGFVMFSVESGRYDLSVTRGVVENLYVVPESRGQGIGSRLLSAAETRLRNRGVDAITLDVMAANERARSFYRRHGYSPQRIQLEKPADNGSNEGGVEATESDTHSKGGP